MQHNVGATPEVQPKTPSDLLEDWLFVLASENSRAVNDACGKQGVFKNFPAVQFIFLVCEKLNQSREVKYLAVELFDRFMVKHVEDVYAHLVTEGAERRGARSRWIAILARVEDQMALRAISCVQIASKLHSHYKVVTLSKAKSLLRETGHVYSFDGILNSELRILKTLNYKVNVPSPVVYLDTLLEVLGHNDAMANPEFLRAIAAKVLDVAYVQRQMVYGALFAKATGTPKMGPSDRVQFSSVENDSLFLAASVVCCAAFLINERESKKVLERLKTITGIPEEDLFDFTSVLISVVSEDDDEKG